MEQNNTIKPYMLGHTCRSSIGKIKVSGYQQGSGQSYLHSEFHDSQVSQQDLTQQQQKRANILNNQYNISTNITTVAVISKMVVYQKIRQGCESLQEINKNIFKIISIYYSSLYFTDKYTWKCKIDSDKNRCALGTNQRSGK